MDFKRTTALNKIAKMTKRKKVIQGGTSASKTFSIIALLINKAIRNAGITIDIVSCTYNHLETGAIADFKRIMTSTNRWNDDNWHSTKHHYTFSNNTVIRFIALDKPGKARGPRRNVLYVNEANLINFETYYNLESRTSGDIYLDFNPVARFWAHTEVLTQDSAEFIILTYKDNEGLPQTIVDELESNRKKAITSDYWKNWCKVMLDGEVGTLEGVIFNNWTEIDSIPEEAELLGYGMDFGFTNDPTTCVALYRWNKSIIMDQIIYQKGLSNSQIANLLTENNVRGQIFADSAEPKSIAEIQQYGFDITPTKKGADSIVYGIGLLQEQPILVTRRSTELKNELERYMWQKDKDGFPLNVPGTTWNHAIDAARYIGIMKLGQSAPTIEDFRIEFH